MTPSDEISALSPEPAVEWTEYDAVLHYTCAVVQGLRTDGLQSWRPVPTMARLDPGERPVVDGAAVPLYFQAAGDGSYTTGGMFAFGSAAFVAGAFAVNAIANNAAKRRAQADLQRRWMSGPPGGIMVSASRVLFWNSAETFSIYWSGVDMVDLTAPDMVMFRYRGRDDGREIIIQLHTYWASLIFALAAMDSFPNHPRWIAGDWLPVGFEDRCEAAGHPRPNVR